MYTTGTAWRPSQKLRARLRNWPIPPPSIPRSSRQMTLANTELFSVWADALALHVEFERSSSISALNEAITTYRTIQEQVTYACDNPTPRKVQNYLGRALTRRFLVYGDPIDIQEAIGLLRQASACDAPVSLTNLVEALYTDYKIRGITTSLSESVSLGRRALDLDSTDLPRRRKAMLHLAHALVYLYGDTTLPESLEECLALARGCLRLCSDLDAFQHKAFYLLGLALFEKIRHSPSKEQLCEAEEAVFASLAARPPGHPDRHDSLHLLSNISRLKSTIFVDVDHLDRAIKLGKDVLELRPVGHPLRTVCLSNLSSNMHTRWLRSAEVGDLEDVIAYGRESLALCPAGHSNRWYSLNNLAIALRAGFERYGATRMNDIDEAAQLHRKALAEQPRGHWRYNMTLTNLATLFSLRHQRTGDLNDLHQSMIYYREALELYDVTHVFRSDLVTNLASTLLDRYEYLHAVEDLEEGIALIRCDLASGDVCNPTRRPPVLTVLADLLAARFEEQKDIVDIDEAIALLEEARSTCSGPYLPAILSSLAEAYIKRAAFLSSAEDTVSANRVFDQVLACYPRDHPERAVSLLKRASLELRQMPAASPRLLLLAYSAATDISCNPQPRLTGLLQVLNTLSSHWVIEPLRVQTKDAEEILKLYSAAASLLPQVAYFGMHIDTRLRVLGQGGNVAPRAIAYGSVCGRLEQALEILEESRSVFWTQSLRLRTPFDDLPDEIRDEMTSLSVELELGSFVSNPSAAENVESTVVEEDSIRRRKQTERLQILITKARSLPGYERFMLQDEYATLRKSASEGPVVALVPSVLSCDALVLKPSGELFRVHLQNVSMKWLEDASQAWNEAIGQARSALREDRLKVTQKPRDARLRVVNTQQSILQHLWTKVVRPVLHALQLQRARGKDRPRLWWCCSGAFAFLPVHAAYSGSESCSDYVVSSYTPNLGALLKARRDFVRGRLEDAKVLLAATACPLADEGFDVLQQAVKEVSDIASIIPPTVIMPLPAEEDALDPAYAGGLTADTFLNSIPKAVVLHVACHGSQDAKNPLDSAFILKDGRLSIARLMSMSLPNASLAFLSACETARGDANYAEENIHLGAAMLFAGFRSVVGTMWSMDDMDGPMVSKTVYERLFDGDSEYLELDRVPYALDEAVRRLRERGFPPGRWATYIHLGI